MLSVRGNLEEYSSPRRQNIGKIPPARNHNHSFKRGRPASYLWVGMAQLEQVKELAVDEVENLPPTDEEVELKGKCIVPPSGA